MATLRWTAGDEEQPDQVVVFASAFVAPRWSVFVSMLRSVRGITGQLRGSDGAVGYALRAQLLRRRMTTVSVWRDHASMAAFVRAEPHRSVMLRHRGQLGEPVFATVDQARDDAKLDAERYLAAAVEGSG